jgi:replicative DNA helicase
MNMAYDLASQGHPVLFMSIESTSESVLERLFCYVKRINNYDLLTGQFNTHLPAWHEFLKEIESIPLVLDNTLGRDIGAIDSYITNLKEKPEAVFIDHIQDTDTMAKSEREGIDKYLRHIRYLAIQFNFAVVACSQQNRASQGDDDKRPKLHQIKGSGGIEQISDIVLLLYYEGQGKAKDYAVNQKIEIHVAKNRDGLTGYIDHNDIVYFPWFYSIEDKQKVVPPPTQKHQQVASFYEGTCTQEVE